MDPLIFAILAAFIPAFGWLVYFYRKDKLNPEPTRVVIAFFIWGGAFAVPAALLLATLTESTVDSLNIDTTAFIGVFLLFFLVAGLPEETIKGLLAAFRARKEPNVDEPADPMLYFTSLGLGFGAVETRSVPDRVLRPVRRGRHHAGIHRDGGPRPVDGDHGLLLWGQAIRHEPVHGIDQRHPHRRHRARPV